MADALPGPASSDPSCLAAEGLTGAADVAVSPDGAHVYVAAEGADAVALLVRDPLTGSLSQPAGPSACISTLTLPIPGDPPILTDAQCGAAAPLDGAASVAVSPDGAHVYVVATGSRTVTTFARDVATGALSVGPCLTDDVGDVSGSAFTPGCQPVLGLNDPRSVVLSADGAHVYVTSALGGSVAVFERDPVSGAPALGCVADHGAIAPDSRCAAGPGLAGARGLAISADGATVYVAAAGAGAVRARRGERCADAARGPARLHRSGGGPGCAALGADSKGRLPSPSRRTSGTSSPQRRWPAQS